MMRRALLVLTLAIPIGSFAQSKPISYTAVAGPASRVLPELGKVLGENLMTTPAVADEVIVLRLKEVSGREALDRVAKALNATWSREEAGLRLVRTPTQVRDEERTRLAQRTEQARAMLAAQAQQVAKMAPWSEPTARRLAEQLEEARQMAGSFDRNQFTRVQTLDNQTPVKRLAMRVAALLDPVELAKIEIGQRVVFSSRPTRVQRPLPAAVSAAIPKFVEEQALWARAADGVVNPQRNGYFSEGAIFTRPADRVGKLLVAVNRNEFSSGSIQVRVILGDVDGDSTLARATTTLQAGPGTQAVFNQVVQNPEGTPYAFTFSPDTQAMIDAFRPVVGAAGQTELKPLPAPVLAQLLQPEQRDPLSFATSEILLQAVEQENRNLVAVMPDFAYGIGLVMSAGKITPSSLRIIARELGLTIEDAPGWMSIQPSDPISARRSRIDRRALGTFVRSVHQKGRSTLEDRAAFALGLPRDQQATWLAMTTVALVQARRDGMDGFDRDMLRFYGSLTPAQKGTLASNGKVSLQSLTPVQVEALDAIVYASERNSLRVQRARVPSDQAPILADGFENEPTELVPNGFTIEASFTMKTQQETVAQPVTRDPNTPARMVPMTAGSFAWQLYALENPSVMAGGQSPGLTFDFERIVLGERRTLTFDFQLTPQVGVLRTLNDDTMGKVMPYRDAPAAFRDAVDRSLVQIRESFNRRGSGSGARPATAPPAR